MSIDNTLSGNPGDGYAFDHLALQSAAVPEPSTLLLLGTGLVGLIACGGRKRKVSDTDIKIAVSSQP